MLLNRYINIDMHFQNSINLNLDLNNLEKINSYIPTDSGIDFLNYYLDTMIKPNTDRSTMMIAPYGKGKSHAILILITLLSLTDYTSISVLLNKIKKIDETLYIKIKTIEKKKYMPIIISNTRGSLSQALSISLKKSLISNNLNNITLNSEFDESINRIHDWKNNYPSTYESLKNELAEKKMSINSLISNLEEYNESSLDIFKELHKKILSGTSFVSESNLEVSDYYQEVNKKIISLGYSGMFIVFDEFTKFLESRDEDTISNDMKIIQDFAELANSSLNQEFTLQLVLHKPISEYESMQKSIKNAFKGIEGRVSPYYFTATMKNSFDLISNVIEKNDKTSLLIEESRNNYNKYLEDSLNIPGLSYEFDDYYRTHKLINDIFPLTPLAAYILVKINEKVAQNERTLFTFLAKDAKNTLIDVIKKDIEIPFVRPSIVFDYFKNQLIEEKDNLQLKKIANNAMSALSSTNNSNEQEFIKTLALILMINDKSLLPSNISVIRNALMINDVQSDLLFKSLIEKNIIVERAGGFIEFKVNIGFKIENVINDLINRKFTSINLVKELNSRNNNKYIYPKLYNSRNAITRFYRSEFIEAKDFMNLTEISYYFKDELCDGLILNVLPNDDYDLNDIKKQVGQLNCVRLIVSYPKSKKNYTKTIQWLLAIEALQKDNSFMQLHSLASSELKLFYEDYVSILYKDLTSDYSIESKNNNLLNVYHGNELKSKMRNISKNRVLGEIFSYSFNSYPIINLEMLNKWNVKGTYKKARIELDDALLTNNYDFNMLGTSPKDTIINCLLKTTGLLDKTTTHNMGNMINIIEDFFKRESGNFKDLYEILTAPPIGIRYGVIPVFVSYVIGRLPYKLIIKKNGIDQALSGTLIDETIECPSNFDFQIDKITKEKQQYLEGIANIFNTEIVTTSSNIYNDLYFSIRKWYMALPRITKEMIGKSDIIKNDEYKKLKKYCNAQNMNASDFILELLPSITTDKNKMDKILNIKTDLELFADNYKQKVKEKINSIMGYQKDTNVCQSINNWYLDNKSIIENKILDSIQKEFIELCKTIDKYDEFTAINKIAYIHMNLFVEDWSSNTIIEFENEFSKINNLLLFENDSSNKILIQIGDKSLNSVFDNCDDPVIEMVQERIVDAISDFGDLLSNEQKVGLLVNIIEKYL